MIAGMVKPPPEGRVNDIERAFEYGDRVVDRVGRVAGYGVYPI
jgi:hypothetical protein